MKEIQFNEAVRISFLVLNRNVQTLTKKLGALGKPIVSTLIPSMFPSCWMLTIEARPSEIKVLSTIKKYEYIP